MPTAKKSRIFFRREDRPGYARQGAARARATTATVTHTRVRKSSRKEGERKGTEIETNSDKIS